MDKIIFTSNFSGSYDLFRFIIQSYRDELPYAGLIKNFTKDNNYSETAHSTWNCVRGMNIRIWNILQKDLTIAYLCGRIGDKPFDLEEIKKEYLRLNNNGTILFKSRSALQQVNK